MTIAYPSVEDHVRADIEAAKTGLLAILPRVSAMNSFLRSPVFRRYWYTSALAHVVYHYKREALIRATRLEIAEHRRAEVSIKCRDCGGTGRYTDWGGKCIHDKDKL